MVVHDCAYVYIPSDPDLIATHVINDCFGTPYMRSTIAAVYLYVFVQPQESYKIRLKEFNDAVAQHETRTVDNFIMGRVAFIVDDGADEVKRKRKLENAPICTEKRRKLFVMDFMCDKGLNWEQARALHRSIFAPLKMDIP